MELSRGPEGESSRREVLGCGARRLSGLNSRGGDTWLATITITSIPSTNTISTKIRDPMPRTLHVRAAPRRTGRLDGCR
jgi:hypothetical protein